MMDSSCSEKPSEPQRCKATRRGGSPCRAWAVKDGLCVGHQPGAAAARSKGGRNSSKSARLGARMSPRLRDLLTLLEDSLRDVRSGNLTAARASAVSALASAVLKVLEVADLELRLADLEAKLGKNGK